MKIYFFVDLCKISVVFIFVENLMLNLGSVFHGLSKVILKGGVVGKITGSLSVFVVVMGIVAWSIGNVWLGVATLAIAFVLMREILLKLIDFANKHPQAALLEGAEFIQHERLIHQSKDHAIINVANEIKEIADPEREQELLAVKNDALIPDIETENEGGK